MAESRRAINRILSNYGRLFATVSLGLYLTILQVHALGEYGFGLLALLGSTTGFAAIFEQVTGWSMIRELGAAHHSGDRAAFRQMFNSAIVVCFGAALVSTAVFVGLIAMLSHLEIAEALRPAARSFLIAKAVETAVLVLLTPQCNLYMVQERMVAYNFWLVCRRATLVVAAGALFWLNPGGDPARGLIIFGWLSTALFAVVMLIPAAIITFENSDLIPRLGLARWVDIRSIVQITGWNFLMQGAGTLSLPLGAILMNLWFGVLFGNVVFGVATRLGGYTRMFASGMSSGLDAVATRVSVVNDNHASMHQLVRMSTLLHGLVVFPSVIGVYVLAEPMLRVWLGKALESNPETLPSAVVLLRVFLIGFMGWAMFDCWTRIMYGAGHVKKYAPLVVATNIAVFGLSLAFYRLLPEHVRYTCVACGYSCAYVVAYGTILPKRLARVVGVSVRDIYQPLLAPLVAAVLCSPILMLFVSETRVWTLRQLILAIVSYAAAYALLAWYMVLPPNLRMRLATAAQLRPSS